MRKNWVTSPKQKASLCQKKMYEMIAIMIENLINSSVGGSDYQESEVTLFWRSEALAKRRIVGS